MTRVMKIMKKTDAMDDTLLVNLRKKSTYFDPDIDYELDEKKLLKELEELSENAFNGKNEKELLRIADELDIDIEEMKMLKNMPYERLDDVTKQKLDLFRNSIEAPEQGDDCVKYMTKADLNKKIKKKKFSGSFIKNSDINDASPSSIKNTLGLEEDLPDDELVRVKWEWEEGKPEIPTRDMHPTWDDRFTGTGFTKSTDGTIIPEWEKRDKLFPSNPTYEKWDGKKWIPYNP
jgi:hypothetical protein